MTRPPGRLGRGVALVALLGGVSVGVSTATGSGASLALSTAALTTYRTCLVSATPTTTPAVADAEVRQGNATTNYGTASTLVVSSNGSANRRSYVRFDLARCTPTISSNATIVDARLRLFVTALPAVCRTLDIFPATAAWTESGLTWGNQPLGTVINTPASLARTDSFDVGTPTGCENRVANAYTTGADVTADVSRFVSGSAVNHGWMIRDDVEGSGTARTVTMSAKQLGTIGRVPQLVVTYVPAP